MEEAPLLDRTYLLLDRSTLKRPEIAKGADVGLEWLKKFEARAMEDPSVRRVQRVFDFLMANPSEQEPAQPAAAERRAVSQRRL